jgi:hypothetical protein
VCTSTLQPARYVLTRSCLLTIARGYSTCADRLQPIVHQEHSEGLTGAQRVRKCLPFQVVTGADLSPVTSTPAARNTSPITASWVDESAISLGMGSVTARVKGKEVNTFNIRNSRRLIYHSSVLSSAPKCQKKHLVCCLSFTFSFRGSLLLIESLLEMIPASLTEDKIPDISRVQNL